MNFDSSAAKQPFDSIDKVIKLENKFTLKQIDIQLKTDGEKVSAAKINGEIDIFNYLTSTFEQNSWLKGSNYLFDKYLPYKKHIQFAYVHTIEKLIGNYLSVSERVDYIRTIMLELERISSHLGFLARLVKTFSFPLLYSRILQSNQQILLLMDKLNESGDEHPFITIGGVALDIDKTKEKLLRSTIDTVEKSIKNVQMKIKRSVIMKGILKETGFLSRETAKNFSLGGPMARSSGITIDVRKTDPYAAYDKVTFTIPVYDSCDIFGEVMVRIDEINESIKIIRQLLYNLPSGRIFEKVLNIDLPNSNKITRIETPFGELFIFVTSKNGSLNDNPKVFRMISPIKLNTQGLLARLTGEVIENIPLILTAFGNGWQ
ncbi:MAG: hypothetical protein FK730_00495 [Asgard group archaeon]|nr:hypothetical protein [Asgard group archaeon]